MKHKELYKILKQEIKPALGCTGPIGICYCAAEAYDAVGGKIESIDARIDWGFGAKCDDVAFPGSRMLGVEMAIALGAVCGDAAAGLEVLHSVTPECELKARAVAEKVHLEMKWEREELGLSCDVTVHTDKGTGHAAIAQRSDGLILKECNGEVLEVHEEDISAQSGKLPILKYMVKDFYDMVMSLNDDELAFLKDAVTYNTELAQETFDRHLGAGIGCALYESSEQNYITRAKAYAAAGCEARMSGANHAAMTCANKGNVGIAASMPLVSLAKDLELPEKDLLRSIAMSYMVAISIIHRIGKAPSMCSCEVAATLGTAAGATLLRRGSYEQIVAAMQNTVPNVFGVVCDGAKLACALRISSGTGIAIECSDLALKGIRIANNQGVLGNTIDETIDIIGRTALRAMVSSDRELSKMIFAKRKIFPLMTFEERQKQ
ncbi:MAG: L-serine ammonia-lyase, iron-sulfur-dependent, subunit alpha [Peptococcaceae bacterium]|nr:L-serine ammonia-lyase, iron-sulfur-dependent, subunit alpha [Peptococcaceae bacterium]